MNAMLDMESDACRECHRRSWLLGRLSTRLDYQSRSESRLLELLALPDERLIQAIAGKLRPWLRREWERFETDAEPDAESDAEHGAQDARDTRDTRNATDVQSLQTICRHRAGYPRGLCERPEAPRMLYVLGHDTERLASLTSKPAVAIVGSAHPTDYGMEMARSLARALSASGVTIVSGLANGIAAAAHDGALEAGGATVTVMAGGVDVVSPAGRRGLYARVVEHGCAVSERPCGLAARRWCQPARARTIVGMTQLTIVVEAGSSSAELMYARIACRLGATVAAVPGRVTSPASVGTNVLLMAGAPLVRGPADALEALYHSSSAAAGGAGRAPGPHWHEVEALLAREDGASRTGGLEPRLRSVFEQVGAGRDTPGKLAQAGHEPGKALLALSELELAGLLGRGDGGRYVPRESLAG